MVIPNPSELKMLRTLMGLEAAEDLVLHLFRNNYTPGVNDVVSSYTEMSSLGYGEIQIPKASWSIVTDGGTNRAVATYPEQVWTFQDGTAVTVYGYYITRQTTGDLWYAERFATSHVVQNLGDKIKLTLVMSLSQ